MNVSFYKTVQWDSADLIHFLPIYYYDLEKVGLGKILNISIFVLSLYFNKNWTQFSRIVRKSPVVNPDMFQCMKLQKFSMQNFSPGRLMLPFLLVHSFKYQRHNV